MVKGAGHFRTTIAKGIEIIEGLRGHTSGYAIPTYVVDAPDGGGKVPVMPQYLISQAPGRVVLRNYEGYITTYDEPLDYDPHAIDHLDRQASERSEPGQVGVAGLLTGKIPFIKPEGFDDTHRRNGIQHRLNANDAKWQRFRMDQPDPGRKPADKPNGQNGKRNGNGAAKSNGNGRNKAKPARNGARTSDGAE